MSHLDIIRAWKDDEYRLSLSEAERAQLPEHPAGLIELEDEALGAVAGGFTSFWGCKPPPHTQEEYCTTPCTTSLACPNDCGVEPPHKLPSLR